MPRASVVFVFVLVLLAFASPAVAQTQLTDAQIAELAAHLDDDADILHADYTPSVWQLCGAGPRGALAVVDRLDAADLMTRMHAERVVECVGMRWVGWTSGRGYADGAAGEQRVRALLHANGDYGHDQPSPARRASMARWRAWLEARRTRPYPPPVQPWPEQITAALEQPRIVALACLPATAPSVTVTLTLLGAGSVSRVTVERPVHGTPAEACVVRAIRAARGPLFSGPPMTMMTRLTRRDRPPGGSSGPR